MRGHFLEDEIQQLSYAGSEIEVSDDFIGEEVFINES
jgi:hypothetical protein